MRCGRWVGLGGASTQASVGTRRSVSAFGSEALAFPIFLPSARLMRSQLSLIGVALGFVTSLSLSRCTQGKRTITAISEALCKNLSSGPVKVRWNAAYAFGNLFKNEGLAFGQTDWGVSARTCMRVLPGSNLPNC